MKNKLSLGIILLIFMMTAITFSLGNMMYNFNLKKTEQNVIGVELADFIYNINYSMQFGKKIETFYGMEEQLYSVAESFQDIQDLYIISEENQILFATEKAVPDNDICTMIAGENKIAGQYLYCMYQLSKNATILVKSSSRNIKIQLIAHMKKLLRIALAGMAAVMILTVLFWKILKNKNTAFRVSFILLLVWILLFGGWIGFEGYQVYCTSLDTVFETIRYSIRSDFNQIAALGVPENRIFEIEQYLLRYTDMIPEVEQIQVHQEEIVCIPSSAYRQKIILDYSLQTVLLLTFSVLILTEYRLFIFIQSKQLLEPRTAQERMMQNGES